MQRRVQPRDLPLGDHHLLGGGGRNAEALRENENEPTVASATAPASAAFHIPVSDSVLLIARAV